MKILIKFPTRSRPDKFFYALDLYYKQANDIKNIEFLISCDLDDLSMNNENVIAKLETYKNLKVVFSNNTSKIEAVNSGLNDGMISNYDIVLLASDDMHPIVYGYDDIIREYMKQYFPDLDGVLWFNDGIQGLNLNTLCILGSAYYKRFGFIYHPAYKSFYCDNEFTEVSKKLNKCVYIDEIIIKHNHHCINPSLIDDLYIINDRNAEQDRITWEKRRSNNYE